jgi:hypothetical protein
MSDAPEIWFDKGVTEGLPLVPPTRERVERTHATTDPHMYRHERGLRRVRSRLSGERDARARALRLLLINVGGARPGETSMPHSAIRDATRLHRGE